MDVILLYTNFQVYCPDVKALVIFLLSGIPMKHRIFQLIFQIIYYFTRSFLFKIINNCS